jgi:dienelactone hydrolase
MQSSTPYEADGRTYSGTFVAPDVAAAAGILVLHGGGGPTAHDLEVADRFMRLGYAAYVPDLFGQVFEDRRAAIAVIGKLVAAPAVLRMRLNAALGRLCAELGNGRPVAVVGHCFGGMAALELARSEAPICAAVAIHGGLHTREPARPGQIRGRILACTGAADPFCTSEHRSAFEAEMTAAEVDWQHHIYGDAVHGFSIPSITVGPEIAYHEPSARRSWKVTLDLLEQAMGGDNLRSW